ncbi:uncharacterized protein [Littorina saxatilis]|uniref:Uncharacterized protein n=1 Tax=Littorina saxatilis TaxID=31220 RepID=A0AAN9AZ92_9CAEN
MTTQAAPAATGASNSSISNATSVTSLPSNASFHDDITSLWNMTLPPLPNSTSDGKDFFHHLTLKDETTFVALVVMGIVVPAIFITVFVLICRQRRKDLVARRTQMLLQNTQDFALEDYDTMDKAINPPPKL